MAFFRFVRNALPKTANNNIAVWHFAMRKNARVYIIKLFDFCSIAYARSFDVCLKMFFHSLQCIVSMHVRMNVYCSRRIRSERPSRRYVPDFYFNRGAENFEMFVSRIPHAIIERFPI